VRWRVLPAVLISLAAGLAGLGSASQVARAASQGMSLISAGDSHSCAIESGKAYCWGDNSFGELGEGSTPESSVPVAVDTSGVLAGKTLIQITTGDDFTCALDSAGSAYCWGSNYAGGLGNGSTVSYSSAPVAVDTSGVLAGVTLTRISANAFHACVLDSAGAAFCWGYNNWGQLGDGSTTNSSVPVAVDASGVLAGKALTQISANYGSTCALDASGAAYCWGYNHYGELGDGSTADSSVPVAVDTSGVPGNSFTQLADGGFHACALDASGAAYCWGYNGSGQLGDDAIADSSVPVAVDTAGVLAGKTLTHLAGGWDHTCALDSAGSAYCWGLNHYGQLGNGSTNDSSVPQAVNTSGVLADKILAQIAASWGHTCAVDAAGAAYCWGDGVRGDLGDNATSEVAVAVLTGPDAPAGVTAVPGDTTVTVSWTAPASLDTGTLTGYTAIASPGGNTCTTAGATTCTITSLANGTDYGVTVVAHTTVGDSGASAPVSVTPRSGLAITSSPADTAASGVPFTFIVTASGTPVPKITRTGRLPSGVRFTAHSNGTATITGTPGRSAAGPYPLTFTARNSAGNVTQAFTLTVTRAPTIKKAPPRRATVGVPVSLTITSAGYPVAALTESGALPAGLTFTDNRNGTGTIAGTPAAGSGGSYSITITATSTIGSASQEFNLKVREPPATTSADTVAGAAFTS
jgi:alpha-tubulin suppressor-like RCC1 family protein